MPLTFVQENIPLAFDADGVMRVGGTRVTLETVLEAFEEGLSAEEIAQQYPTLELADIYQVIGYSLRHAGEVEEYLERRGRQAEKNRKMYESRFNQTGIRERLLARKSKEDSSKI